MECKACGFVEVIIEAIIEENEIYPIDPFIELDPFIESELKITYNSENKWNTPIFESKKIYICPHCGTLKIKSI